MSNLNIMISFHEDLKPCMIVINIGNHVLIGSEKSVFIRKFDLYNNINLVTSFIFLEEKYSIFAYLIYSTLPQVPRLQDMRQFSNFLC